MNCGRFSCWRWVACPVTTDQAGGEFEDLQKPLGLRGTPYYLFEHNGRLWIPQITRHSSIVSFRLDPDGAELADRRVLFDFGPPTAVDRKRMGRLPR